MIKKLELEYYKGFYQKEKLEFAIPNDTSKGCGLTIIVGPNNTGKTSLIEALLLSKNSPDKKFKETERHRGKDPSLLLEDHKGYIKRLTNIEKGSLIRENLTPENVIFDFVIDLIPSRRFWQHSFRNSSNLSDIVDHSSNALNIRSEGNFQLGPYLRNILEDRVKKKKFDEYLKFLIPHFTSWTIDTNDEGSDFIKYKASGAYHQANLLGDGIISLFRVIAHMINEDIKSTIIIDEPELSLHPSAQKRLSTIISKVSRNRQIIVSTHSPYFVNWEDYLNGAHIIRLNKHEGKKCTVHRLPDSDKYKDFISSSIHDYQKPQLLDVVAKEILFSDKILFTEGQEDVGLLRQWGRNTSKNNQFETFGYGVGGENNMALFLEMSKDIGLAKVGALYDGNSLSFEKDKGKYSTYCLRQLPTADIRDKPDKDKVGVFSSDGNLKQEYEEEFNKIMTDFDIYFK